MRDETEACENMAFGVGGFSTAELLEPRLGHRNILFQGPDHSQSQGFGRIPSEWGSRNITGWRNPRSCDAVS
jgi:hypothetical protein